MNQAIPETIDLLSRSLRLIQHRDGHRATSDDQLLAWAACRAQPKALRVLDLGCGKGTVALLLLRQLPGARVMGIEALPVHHSLAVRNAELNGLADRFQPLLGDLRDAELLRNEPPFELICGAPPFMPLGSGLMPADPGRAVGRFEIRGGIEAYALTAARHLAPGGRVVLLMDGRQGDRTIKALRDAELHPRRRVVVRPRPAQKATYRLFEAAHEADSLIEEDLCLRGAVGSGWSPEYLAIRIALDLPVSSTRLSTGSSG